MRHLKALFYVLAFCIHAATPARADETLNGIPRDQIGVNAFANDPRFGTVAAQLKAVKNDLRIKHIRILFAWNDDVQPTPSSTPNFSFYDDIARNIPKHVTAVAVLTGVPSWMADSANWSDGSPRTTFARLWIEKVLTRYKSSRIGAYQIWNEPNDQGNPNNEILGFSEPANYVELLALADNARDTIAPKKRLVSAATTSIGQNFPRSLNYNLEMKEAGAETFIDVWGVHFYGKNYYTLILPGGVSDFLNDLSKPIWLTESGAKGASKQLSYVRQAWPTLRSLIPGIQRFYLYQYHESTPAASSYGLRNLSGVSDLYRWLRSH